jgi:protein N-terminal amidase
MRIATLQFAPKLGDVKGNIETANALLKKGKTISVDGEQLGLGLGVDLLKPDVLVLPEMALTGTYLDEAYTPFIASLRWEWLQLTLIIRLQLPFIGSNHTIP